MNIYVTSLLLSPKAFCNKEQHEKIKNKRNLISTSSNAFSAFLCYPGWTMLIVHYSKIKSDIGHTSSSLIASKTGRPKEVIGRHKLDLHCAQDKHNNTRTPPHGVVINTDRYKQQARWFDSLFV
jgi:hypothetical protein